MVLCSCYMVYLNRVNKKRQQTLASMTTTPEVDQKDVSDGDITFKYNL